VLCLAQSWAILVAQASRLSPVERHPNFIDFISGSTTDKPPVSSLLYTLFTTFVAPSCVVQVFFFFFFLPACRQPFIILRFLEAHLRLLHNDRADQSPSTPRSFATLA